MYLSAMLTSLPLDFAAALRQARDLGFAYVDVRAVADRSHADLEALADTGLLVWCAAVGQRLPEGLTLDAADGEARRAALELTRRHVADAARLGATQCYVVPGHDPSRERLKRFADACLTLTDYAAARMVELCVEHVPGRALPTAAATLEWLERVGHDGMKFLLDVGHCLITDEDPAWVAARAGRRLGYVHLDDNDSVEDLHWPLLTGRLTADMLEAVLTVLTVTGYAGGVALELNPNNPDPVRALSEGRKLVRDLVPGIE